MTLEEMKTKYEEARNIAIKKRNEYNRTAQSDRKKGLWEKEMQDLDFAMGYGVMATVLDSVLKDIDESLENQLTKKLSKSECLKHGSTATIYKELVR